MRVPSTDGVTLQLHDLGGEGPLLLLAHATGFCAGAYAPFAARLAERFHVWALDFRAHGDSTGPDDGDLSWHGMVADVLAVVDALGGGPVLAYGHSMGGACLAGAERARPGTIERAVLFEPIIFPAAMEGPGENPLAASARRRRPGFPSRLEALSRYAGRPPLGVFRADALHAYVEHGFADRPDGTVALKCTPEAEAATFEASGKPRTEEMVDVGVPVLVTRGARDPGPRDLAPPVAEALPLGELRTYEHLGHFGPFQDPDTLAEDAATWLAG